MSSGIVDLHSHLVPGVDDGARDLAESLAALDRLVEAGVTTIVTTPHLDASLIQRAEAFERNHETVASAWTTLVEAARERHPGVSIGLAREVLLDAAIPHLEDPRVRLAGGRYVLVEFPRLLIPPASDDVLYRVRSAGYVPIVAHVERYAYHGSEARVLDEWRTTGAAFQVNTPSLVGSYGNTARDLAWRLLERGWVDLLSSDYHARGRTWIPEARAALAEQGGEIQLSLLMTENPARVVRDEALEEVPPLVLEPPPGRWSKLWGALRRQA